jgi:proline iminopeptidase
MGVGTAPLVCYLKYAVLTPIVIMSFCCAAYAQRIKNGDYFEKVGELRLYYCVRGNGPVMIVGHPTSGKIGYQLSLKLLEQFFTMVYYDPRGTGKSETPMKLESYEQEQLVFEMENLRCKLKQDKIWIFGHSDQSAIGLLYALHYPSHTAGLILSGTSLLGTQQESNERRKETENIRRSESHWFAEIVRQWDYMLLHHTATDSAGNDLSDVPLKWWCYNEESAQKVVAITKEVSKAGRRKPIDGQVYMETNADRQWYLDQQNRFPGIKTNILIINGKYDTNNPREYTRQLHDVLPNSQWVEIDSSGHFPWIENAHKTFEEVGKWLKSLSKE